MCGIVAYIGKENAVPVLLDGLKKLEYRGYDSCGISLLNPNLYTKKIEGRVAGLEDLVSLVNANIGIGHTRWATHGVPNEVNAHPHASKSNRFIIVHNGTIDNYVELKNNFFSDLDFTSETDTEVLINLFEKFYNGSIYEVAKKFQKEVDGSYAIVVLDTEDSDKLYVIKNRSPLLIGLGKEENYIASDIGAMIKYTNEFYDMEDNECAIVRNNEIEIFTVDGELVKKDIYKVDSSNQDISLGHYSHFMLKEIEEQPAVLRRIIDEYSADSELIEKIKNSERIYIIASGTSYNAGLVSKQIFEEIAKIPVEVHLGSEFSYFTPILSEKSFFVFLSQSGETADSIKAFDIVTELNYPSLSITNVITSTLARKTDFTINLNAGKEVAVASTKAYTSQIAVMTLLASEINEVKFLKQELSKVALVIDELIARKSQIEKLVVENIATSRNCFYIGRGLDYAVAVEASLKLKEVSYIQTEGFASAELKHGTISLIEEGVPVIGLLTNEKGRLTRSNLLEVKSRLGNTMTISMKDVSNEEDDFVIPNVHPLLTPLVLVVPTQYIAYYCAIHRGCDVDKPRNLAKAVTVE